MCVYFAKADLSVVLDKLAMCFFFAIVRVIFLFLAFSGVNCQQKYIIATDEITDACDCYKFGVSITYKNGGNINDILTNDENAVYPVSTGCVVTYVDPEDKFEESTNLEEAGSTCLAIGENNVYSTVYNYTENASSLVDMFISIDTTGLPINPCVNNTSRPAPAPTSASAPSSVPASSSASSPSPNSSPAPAPPSPAPVPTSAPPSPTPVPTSAPPSPAPVPTSSPSPNSSPVPPNAAIRLKPVFAWILVSIVIALLMTGGSRAEVAVIKIIQQCGSGSTEDSSLEAAAIVTQQADALSASLGQASGVAGGDGGLAADTFITG